jgi:hypothetical protein
VFRTLSLDNCAWEVISYMQTDGTQMSKSAWTFEYSIECNTSRQFAWSYWTNISNWNDPPARFELDGPFAIGSRLTTTLPGQIMRSIIRDVQPDRAATIETELPDGVLSFQWNFEDLSENHSRITQRLVLSATNAALVAQASLMEQSVPLGMNKLVGAIERAERLLR